MTYTSIDIRFEGNKFYPSRLIEKTQLPIQVLSEYGKTSTKGRYKGKSSPYGMAVLQIEAATSQREVNELIKKYSENLIKNKNELLESGVEEIIFNLGSPKSFSTEISLAPDILNKLALLNARIEFFTISDEEDLKIKMDRFKHLIPASITDKFYEEILKNLNKHPSISKADTWDYLIYYFFYNKSYSPEQLNESLDQFENFYNNVVKEY